MIENTGQIQLIQQFGQYISMYASDSRFSNYVEIGTWNGRGSTCCFYDGFKRRSDKPTLQSYEINYERAQEASKLWEFYPQIRIENGRMLTDAEFPSYKEVKELFPQLHEDWHREDVGNFWTSKYVPMVDNPEVILLDGAEYLTYFEFQKMKELPSVNVYMLDDVRSDKCPRIYEYLSTHPDWKLIIEGHDRNGWAIFEKRNC